MAEPALITVSNQAANIAIDSGLLESSDKERNSYSLGLRLTVAFSVGFSILLGVLPILRNWPIHYLIIGCYCIILLMSLFAPQEIIGIAYHAGVVTTSTVTVPIVAALGLGLSASVPGRNPAIDGIGLIAFASLFLIIAVLEAGQYVQWSISRAQEKLRGISEEKVHGILVKKRHADDAWGIISAQNIINGVLIPGKRTEEVNVYEIMTKPIMSVPADMDIRYIARLLHRVGKRRAPVEENGKLIGMETLSAWCLANDLFLK